LKLGPLLEGLPINMPGRKLKYSQTILKRIRIEPKLTLTEWFDPNLRIAPVPERQRM
jgi:hypothetical protein